MSWHKDLNSFLDKKWDSDLQEIKSHINQNMETYSKSDYIKICLNQDIELLIYFKFYEKLEKIERQQIFQKFSNIEKSSINHLQSQLQRHWEKFTRICFQILSHYNSPTAHKSLKLSVSHINRCRDETQILRTKIQQLCTGKKSG